MMEESLTYIEKLQHAYILNETKKMLQLRQEEIVRQDDEYETIAEDIRKIDLELETLSDGTKMSAEPLNVDLLFNPVYEVKEEQQPE